jgi:hypothetical protein
MNDGYAQIQPEEQQTIRAGIMEHEETAMLTQYIKNLGRVEGRVEGRQAVIQRLVTKCFFTHFACDVFWVIFNRPLLLVAQGAKFAKETG